MQGALLRSGKYDGFIALGDTGQPVHKAALQIIAALERRAPDLARFLAIPKSNEQGDVFDWYSPLHGEVIPWNSASDDERSQATQLLEGFRSQVGNISQSLADNGKKSGQGDQIIFGKLLGLSSHAPSSEFLYLVEQNERLQPVLTFWGFVSHEADRHKDPLFFLNERPARPPELPATPTTPLAPAMTAAPQPTPLPATASATVVTKRRSGWARFWWLLPLLLLLLLPFLLKYCAPSVRLPTLSGKLPSLSAPDLSVPTPNLRLPKVNLGQGFKTPEPALPSAPSTPNLPEVQPGPAPALPDMQPEPEPMAPALPEMPSSPVQPPELPEVEPITSAEPAPVEPPQLPATAEPAVANQPLFLPPDIGEGPADFLNGSYRAGAGIMDARTARPLRLKYNFEKGQGQVTIERSDGSSCSGPVKAAMHNGSLGIHSQGQASCTDGSTYDMPQVTCKPGAQSIADCAGSYGNTQFPMSMRREE